MAKQSVAETCSMGDITLFEVHLDGGRLQFGPERIGELLSDVRGDAAEGSTDEATPTETEEETTLADKTAETGPNMAVAVVLVVLFAAIAIAAMKFRSKPASELETLDSS